MNGFCGTKIVIILELYKNISQARENPRGLVGVSIFVRLAESIYRKSNFEDFSKYLDRVSTNFTIPVIIAVGHFYFDSIIEL